MEQEISISELNQQIGCYDNLYWKICQLGFILPPIKSCKQVYTIRKLIDIGNKKIYCPHIDDIDTEVRTTHSLTSAKIYDEILKLKNDDEILLNPFHLPPKDFLLKMLYSLKNDHDFFIMEPQPQENEQNNENISINQELLKMLNNGQRYDNRIGTVIKKTKDQREKEEKTKQNQKLNRKKERLSRLNTYLDQYKKKVEETKKNFEEKYPVRN